MHWLCRSLVPWPFPQPRAALRLCLRRQTTTLRMETIHSLIQPLVRGLAVSFEVVAFSISVLCTGRDISWPLADPLVEPRVARVSGTTFTFLIITYSTSKLVKQRPLSHSFLLFFSTVWMWPFMCFDFPIVSHLCSIDLIDLFLFSAHH